MYRKWDSLISFLRMTESGDKSVVHRDGTGYDDGYGFDLECVAKSNFQKVVDCESRLWNMRSGPRHGSDLGDEYTYRVTSFDIADVNCGCATVPYVHPSRRSAGRYGRPEKASFSDESLVSDCGIGAGRPRLATSSQYLYNSGFRVSDGSRLRICGAG